MRGWENVCPLNAEFTKLRNSHEGSPTSMKWHHFQGGSGTRAPVWEAWTVWMKDFEGAGGTELFSLPPSLWYTGKQVRGKFHLNHPDLPIISRYSVSRTPTHPPVCFFRQGENLAKRKSACWQSDFSGTSPSSGNSQDRFTGLAKEEQHLMDQDRAGG